MNCFSHWDQMFREKPQKCLFSQIRQNSKQCLLERRDGVCYVLFLFPVPAFLLKVLSSRAAGIMELREFLPLSFSLSI